MINLNGVFLECGKPFPVSLSLKIKVPLLKFWFFFFFKLQFSRCLTGVRVQFSLYWILLSFLYIYTFVLIVTVSITPLYILITCRVQLCVFCSLLLLIFLCNAVDFRLLFVFLIIIFFSLNLMVCFIIILLSSYCLGLIFLLAYSRINHAIGNFPLAKLASRFSFLALF